MREHARDIEIEGVVELTVKVRGRYTPGAKATPMRGEAVAVECPGWGEGIEDFSVAIVPGNEQVTGIEISSLLSGEAIESLENELIEAARAKLEDSRY